MKKVLKLVKRVLKHVKRIIRRLRIKVISRALANIPDIHDKNERTIQALAALLLQQKYPSLVDKQAPGFEINKCEFKLYSQNGEDGILLHIFSRVGVTNRYFVEFGIGNGRECNTANLSLNFGWHGLLMDSGKHNVLLATRYYREMLGLKSSNIKIINCFITKENIDKVLLDNGIEGSIDLLSIDIDGNDYWVWKTITAIDPRVVVIEYNASFGFDKALTVKYDANFNIYAKHISGFYHGASLAALTKLAISRGYILVGCDSNGVNAFFVRKDVAQGILAEVSVQEAYFAHHYRQLQGLSTSEQFDRIKHLDFYYV